MPADDAAAAGDAVDAAGDGGESKCQKRMSWCSAAVVRLDGFVDWSAESEEQPPFRGTEIGDSSERGAEVAKC